MSEKRIFGSLHGQAGVGATSWADHGQREWDVLGVGDVDVDVFLRVEGLPTRDSKVLGSMLGEFSGGMTGNVCCAASRLGTRAAMIGAVGDDVHGGKATAGLAECGVNTSLIRVVEGGQTFFCIVLLDASGEKALIAVDTELRLPQRSDVDPETFSRARLVHIIGDDGPLVLWAAQEAARRGTLVSVDLEASTTKRGPKALEPLLAHVDIAFLNEAGYRLGFGGEPAEALHAVLGLGPRVVVITRGAQGAFVGSADGVWQIPAFTVPVVDSTGAGDCFIGAFLTCLLEGEKLPDCGRFASAAAALSLQGIGARTALPRREDVLTFLGESSLPQPAAVAP